MEPYFSKDLSERQIQVVAHTMNLIGAEPEGIAYFKAEEYIYDIFPIDIAVFAPTEVFDYYIIQTVGLSSYRFDKNFARSELLMVLPNTWNLEIEKESSVWPIKLLQDIAYSVVDNKEGVMVGSIYGPQSCERYTEYSDAVGGIITLAENFPLEMYEEKIGETYTRFFQVVPITKEDVSKIKEMGSAKFIKFDLHDSEGPQFVVNIENNAPVGIEKIITQNEKTLMGSKK